MLVGLSGRQWHRCTFVTVARKITDGELAALHTVLRGVADGQQPSATELASATRTICRMLGLLHPGGFVELRVPPLAAVQLGIGERGAHTRGTPPNVVETDPETLLQLAAGTLSWADALAGHRVAASGAHADLAEVFPLG